MPDHTAHLVSYGVPFRLRAASADALQSMLAAVPHATTPDPAPSAESELFTLDPTHPEPLALLRQQLMVHVANFAPDYVFLHAGVVALGSRALVLPGSSFAGKTTLTAALVRAGATYYSDEYAVLDPQGLILPYDRHLQVRAPGFTEQTAVPVADLHGTAGTTPVPAALIAFIEYAPDAPWLPTPVTPGLAVLEMLQHTIPVQRTPARVLATLAALVAPAQIFRTARNEADEAARHLLKILASPH